MGKRLPTLETLLADAATVWQAVTMARWYGGRDYPVELTSQTAVWYHTGLPPVPMRWVLVKDPQSKFEPQAFLCTDLTASPEQILQWFRQRWQVEVTFEEVRNHLGVETQRQWSELAIRRTTPAKLGIILTGHSNGSSPASRLASAANGLLCQSLAHIWGCTCVGAVCAMQTSTFPDIY